MRRDESPDGGGRVKSIALNSGVSANVSKLQAIISRQYSRIFTTPYLDVKNKIKSVTYKTMQQIGYTIIEELDLTKQHRRNSQALTPEILNQ